MVLHLILWCYILELVIINQSMVIVVFQLRLIYCISLLIHVNQRQNMSLRCALEVPIKFNGCWRLVQLGIMKVKVAQSCPTLYNSMDYTVYGILQARILEWVAFPFSRGSSEPWGRRQVFCIAGRLLTSWATREIPSPKDLPNPGMEPGSPALQANSLVTEILWKPN